MSTRAEPVTAGTAWIAALLVACAVTGASAQPVMRAPDEASYINRLFPDTSFEPPDASAGCRACGGRARYS